jgi:hypothetical protein
MKRFWLAALLALTASPAHAQLDPGVFPIDMVSPVLPRMMLENVLRDSGNRASRSAQTAPRAGASHPTTYRASPDVSARVKRQYVSFIRKSHGAAAAQQYEQVLARNDPVRNWASLVAEEGFRPGDVAEAFASYWMLNYLMANGLTDGLRGRGSAVAQQVRGIMARNPSFTALNKAQRQEMAEVFMLNFLTQQAAYSHAVSSRDNDLKRRLGEAAVSRFSHEMGVDLRALAMRPQGFEKKG